MRGNRSAGVPERIPYKESKNPFRQAWLGKNRFVDPILQLRGFDKTEVCGKMVRNFMGPGSPIFCLTESSNL